MSEEGPAGPGSAEERLAEVVLGAPVQFTREEAAAAAGLTVEQARPYWRAMGFADVGELPAFTRRDVDALRTLVGWVDDGVFDEETTIEIVRSLGQTASRLADWQVDTMARLLSESESPVDVEGVVEGVTTVLPSMEQLLVSAWRRHLAAVVSRGLAGAEDSGEGELPTATVGFADIAGFTRLVRALADDDLAAMVQAFETGAADIVASRGGRLVKTLGDEVMFVSERADDALGIALAMHELRSPGPDPLRLRIGLATGRVITRMGDVYGSTVNRASRLTAIAKPGGTLMDSGTEDALDDLESVLLRHHRPRALRGLGLVRATSVLRRTR